MALVSVLTTSYNRESFIGECIESVLSSSFEDFEYVIVDDCSTDSSFEVAKAYENRDSRVRVYRNSENLGDYPNRNRAASLAKGTYLKYVDSDDLMYPHCLGVMVAGMQKFPSAGLGLSSYSEAAQPFPVLISPRDAYYQNFFQVDLFGRAPGSAIILREAFEAVGGFSGKRQVGDHEMWLRLARQFEVVKLARDLVWDRQHEQKESLYDSLIEKERLHLEVMTHALMSDDCPLTLVERLAAAARLKTRFRKRFLRELIRGRFRNAIGSRELMKMVESQLIQPIGAKRGGRIDSRPVDKNSRVAEAQLDRVDE